MTAYLHLHDALVYAHHGNTQAVTSSIRRAQDDYANAETDEPTRQTRFLNDAGLHAHTALAYSDLASHDPASAELAVESQMAAVRQTKERRSP